MTWESFFILVLTGGVVCVVSLLILLIGVQLGKSTSRTSEDESCLRGPMGPPGPPGATGMMGPPGDPGPPGKDA